MKKKTGKKNHYSKLRALKMQQSMLEQEVEMNGIKKPLYLNTSNLIMEKKPGKFQIVCIYSFLVLSEVLGREA